MKARIIAKLNKRIEERLTAERDQARNARDIHASEIERLSAKLEASRVCRLTLDEELYDMRARVEALEDALRRIATRDYNETAQAFAEEALDSKEQA